MNFKNETYLISILVVISAFILSCKKFIQIPPAPSLIVSSQVFADSTNANSAVLALYVSMVNDPSQLGTYSGNNTLYTSLASDELYSTTGYTDENEVYSNTINAKNGTISGFWSDDYTVIYKANACIEGLTSSTGISTSAKNQFIGEAKVVRAFSYFNLVNLFGPVPLITSTD